MGRAAIEKYDPLVDVGTRERPASETGGSFAVGKRVALSHPGFRGAFVVILFASIVGGYLVVLKSPLRLTEDSVVYLSMAYEMVGGPSNFVTRGPHYPAGYPLLLAGLDTIGLGVPWAFVALNLIFLAVGICAAYQLSRLAFGFGPGKALLVCIGTVLYHRVIWASASPLSDIPFFGMTMASLLVLTVADRRRDRNGWLLLIAGAGLAAGAVLIRTAGIALFPAVVLGVLRRPELEWLHRSRKTLVNLTIGGTVIALLVIAAAFVIRGTGYDRHVIDRWSSATSIPQAANDWLFSLGELAAQLPRTRLPSALDPVYSAVGVIVLALVVRGAIRRRKFDVVDAFVISLVAILFVYPGQQSRYWLPVFPALIAYALLGAESFERVRPVRLALSAYAAAFATAGLLSLAASAQVSLSGSDFAARWSRHVEPRLGATIKVAFGTTSRTEVHEIDPDALRILRRYERRTAIPSLPGKP